MITAIVIGSTSFSRYLTYENFRGFDRSGIRTIDTGGKDTNGRAITMRVLVDPQTGARSPAPVFDLRHMQVIMLLTFTISALMVRTMRLDQSLVPALGHFLGGTVGMTIGIASVAFDLHPDGSAFGATVVTIAITMGLMLYGFYPTVAHYWAKSAKVKVAVA